MKKKVLYIISLVLLLQVSAATAQNVILNAKLDTFAMRIGEQTRARLELSIDSGYNVVLPELEKEKLVEGIEVLESKEYSQTVDGGRKKYIQEYLITSFDSTRYEIPPFEIVVDKDTFASNRLILDVYSVEIDTANINNIAGPAEVVDVQLTWEEVRDAIYLAIILILVAVALVMTTISLIKNKPIIRIVKVKPKLPSHVIAINRIDEIRNNESLSAEGNEKEYYTQLTDVLREYMHDRFGIDAQEMTTSEIIDELLKIKDKESIKELKEILEVADLVKFAKMKPDERENRLNMTNAIDFVNETKNAEEQIVQPTEVKIVNERSLLHKRALIAAVVILAVVVLGVIFLLTTDLYNMFS